MRVRDSDKRILANSKEREAAALFQTLTETQNSTDLTELLIKRDQNLANTLQDVEQALHVEFEEYVKACSQVLPVPGKTSIRKIPALPLSQGGSRHDFNVFLPKEHSASLQLELLKGDGQDNIVLHNIERGKPLTRPLQQGLNRVSLICQPKQESQEKESQEKGSRDNLSSSTTRNEILFHCNQEALVIFESDRPSSFGSTIYSGLNSNQQVDFEPGRRPLITLGSSDWPFQIRASLVVEGPVDD